MSFLNGKIKIPSFIQPTDPGEDRSSPEDEGSADLEPEGSADAEVPAASGGGGFFGGLWRGFRPAPPSRPRGRTATHGRTAQASAQRKKDCDCHGTRKKK